MTLQQALQDFAKRVVFIQRPDHRYLPQALEGFQVARIDPLEMGVQPDYKWEVLQVSDAVSNSDWKLLPDLVCGMLSVNSFGGSEASSI